MSKSEQQRPGISPPEPPDQLLDRWNQASSLCTYRLDQHLVQLAIAWATPIVADQELEACCEWLDSNAVIHELRAARRPKPPSLKEQAMGDLVSAYNAGQIDDTTFENIRAALLPIPSQS